MVDTIIESLKFEQSEQNIQKQEIAKQIVRNENRLAQVFFFSVLAVMPSCQSLFKIRFSKTANLKLRLSKIFAIADIAITNANKNSNIVSDKTIEHQNISIPRCDIALY